MDRILAKKTYKSGYLPDEYDERSIKFGEAVSKKSLPQKFSWWEKMPELPTQGDEPACVSMTFSTYAMFKSKQEGNEVNLSPRYLYSLTGKPDKGRNFRSNAKLLQNKGDTLEVLFPNKTELSHDEYCDPDVITQKMHEAAKCYQIKSYSRVDYQNIDEVKQAIYREPIPIAFPGYNKDWKAKYDVIPFSGKGDTWDLQIHNADWYHAVLAVGWENDKIEIANWWESMPHVFLSKGYPLIGAYSLVDLPDDWIDQVKSMHQRFQKGGEQYFKDGNVYFHIPDSETLQFLLERKWVTEVVKGLPNNATIKEMPMSVKLYDFMKKGVEVYRDVYE